jgi:hypothetical protein
MSVRLIGTDREVIAGLTALRSANVDEEAT